MELLELQYGDKWHKSVAAKEQAKEGGLSLWEAKCYLDAELFLDEYPQWEVGGLHCPIILQRMFVHAAKAGQKEAGEADLPRPLAWPARAKSRGSCTHHPACGVLNLQEGDSGPLP